MYKRQSQHKVQNLQRLAERFPHVKWILIGDDGQHDPQIYSGFAQRYPESVAAIVIRNLSPTEAVLASGARVTDRHRVTVPQGVLWIEANDGASISDQLRDAGLL